MLINWILHRVCNIRADSLTCKVSYQTLIYCESIKPLLNYFVESKVIS